MINLLIVAAGGALGAAGPLCRRPSSRQNRFSPSHPAGQRGGRGDYRVSRRPVRRGGLTDRCLLFWKTGVCGGFTTFSAFSLEAVQLFEKGRHLAGSLYILLSLLLCLAGVLAGQALSRLFAK